MRAGVSNLLTNSELRKQWQSPGGATVTWYITSILSHQPLSGPNAKMFSAREYWCTLTADNSDAAYAKSLTLAERIVADARVGGPWILDGTSELLMIADPPASGSELIWCEQELFPLELSHYVRNKNQLRLFNATAEVEVEATNRWYVCELVFVEV